MIEAWVNAIAFAIVAWFALAHIKAMAKPTDCESLGFAILFGAAIGSALEWFWPDEFRPFHVDTLLSVGLALVAIALRRREIRRALGFTVEEPPRDLEHAALELLIAADSPATFARARLQALAARATEACDVWPGAPR